ncbi:MAG: leucine-rich repeat domain-containing protein [Clostridia bacterium]|nr:leucine-rich repeat domain-containing protein [Clostridia bacterium]
MSWNDVDVAYRILPNKTSSATLNSGNLKNGVYVYYALYEKATPDIEYKKLDDGTYSVNNLIKTNVDSLYIPFAKYDEIDNCMRPISKIKKDVFSGIGNQLTEVSIGGAVSEIDNHAFYNVKALKINFAHKGRNIYYNYRQNTPSKHLVIGDSAFASNSVITSLVLPASLETIEDKAFSACRELSKVGFEESVSPYLRNLGNFVFDGDEQMKDNEIVRLLVDDGKDGNNRFVNVGNGIFKNTKVTNPYEGEVDENGIFKTKIVWRDTLLHVYYRNDNKRDLVFNEKYIAGYAFTNLGDSNDSTVHISIKFSNPDVQIKASAFAYLPTNVNVIYLKPAAIRVDNVDINAFDLTVKHSVNVYTNSVRPWHEKYSELINNSNFYFKFY